MNRPARGQAMAFSVSPLPGRSSPVTASGLTGHLAIAGRHAQFDHASCHRQTSRPALPVHLVVVVVSGSGVLPASTNNSRPFIGPRAYSFTDGRLSEAVFAGSRGLWGGASPVTCWLVCVRGRLRGLAGVLGWCEPGDLLVGVGEKPSSRARGGSWRVRARGCGPRWASRA